MRAVFSSSLEELFAFLFRKEIADIKVSNAEGHGARIAPSAHGFRGNDPDPAAIPRVDFCFEDTAGSDIVFCDRPGIAPQTGETQPRKIFYVLPVSSRDRVEPT